MKDMLLPPFDEIVQRVNNQQLWDFPGGIFPPQHKAVSNQSPIAQLTLPERFFVAVKQHIGVQGHLVVEPGDYVLKGQPLTHSSNPFAVPIHAPTSGNVLTIAPQVSAHASGLPELSVEIEPDGKDKWCELRPLQDYQALPKVSVLGAICDAGISGMGGAGFPTHIKAAPKKDLEFLLINGIECEPYITSDDRLMREHAWQIRQGIDVLYHLLSPKQVYIAIEDNKPEAIEAMKVACQENELYKVCIIPTKYPAGGEKQLIQLLTGREVPQQGLPVDVGVIMQNVGTCFAIADAIFSGKPLIQRVVTLTGGALKKPGNVWALIGTPISHLLDCGEYQADQQIQPKAIMGGPMMGFTLASHAVPVVKITNCILLPSDQEMPQPEAEQPCIRCSACADVCPASLLPQQLFWHTKAKELDKAQDYNLFDCIECGACAYVCPSEIPLVHYYRIAKADIRHEREEKQRSDKARERFESRAARLKREHQARDEKHHKAAQARKQAMQASGNNAQDKIAAALARAKAKKAQMGDQSVTLSKDSLALEQQPSSTSEPKSSDKVAAAIARAKAKKAQRQGGDPQVQVPNDSVENPQSLPASQSQNKSELVAGAIARAKAKKAQRQGDDHQAQAQNETVVPPQPLPAGHSQGKSERVAGVIARAKAKKARSQESNQPTVSTEKAESHQQVDDAKRLGPPTTDPDEAQNEGSSAIAGPQGQLRDLVTPANREKTPAAKIPISDAGSANTVGQSDSTDQKKQRIAAAVAKAKAKQHAAQLTSKTDRSPSNEQPRATAGEAGDNPTGEGTQLNVEQALELKKRRIAAAVAKAKAKKAAQQRQTPDE